MRTRQSYNPRRAPARRPGSDTAAVRSARVVIAVVGIYAILLHHVLASRGAGAHLSASTAAPRHGAQGGVGRAASDELPPAAAARAGRPGPRMAAALTRPRPPRWDRNVWARPSRGAYRRCYRMTVTAYRPIDSGIEGGRWTKTERDGQAEHGVAVDPNLIPLGAHLWIPGYGHAVADDIGGMIKGHHIDLRMQEQESMEGWGKRQVPVYLLADAVPAQ